MLKLHAACSAARRPRGGRVIVEAGPRGRISTTRGTRSTPKALLRAGGSRLMRVRLLDRKRRETSAT